LVATNNGPVIEDDLECGCATDGRFELGSLGTVLNETISKTVDLSFNILEVTN